MNPTLENSGSGYINCSPRDMRPHKRKWEHYTLFLKLGYGKWVTRGFESSFSKEVRQCSLHAFVGRLGYAVSFLFSVFTTCAFGSECVCVCVCVCVSVFVFW